MTEEALLGAADDYPALAAWVKEKAAELHQLWQTSPDKYPAALEATRAEYQAKRPPGDGQPKTVVIDEIIHISAQGSAG